MALLLGATVDIILMFVRDATEMGNFVQRGCARDTGAH